MKSKRTKRMFITPEEFRGCVSRLVDTRDVGLYAVGVTARRLGGPEELAGLEPSAAILAITRADDRDRDGWSNGRFFDANRPGAVWIVPTIQGEVLHLCELTGWARYEDESDRNTLAVSFDAVWRVVKETGLVAGVEVETIATGERRLVRDLWSSEGARAWLRDGHQWGQRGVANMRYVAPSAG